MHIKNLTLTTPDYKFFKAIIRLKKEIMVKCIYDLCKYITNERYQKCKKKTIKKYLQILRNS